MGVSLEQYRFCIGTFSYRSGLTGNENLYALGLLLRQHTVATLQLLLIMSGIEPNPGPPAFSCKFCQAVFTSISSYCEHVQVHLSRKNFRIPCCFQNCNCTLHTVRSFQSHINRLHHSEGRRKALPRSNPIKCPISSCNVLIVSRKDYLQHMKDHILEGKVFKCALPSCNYECKTLTSFRSHVSRYHPDEESDFGSIDMVTSSAEDIFEPSTSFQEGHEFTDGVQEEEDNVDSGDDSRTTQNVPDDDLYPEYVVKDELARFYLKLEGEFLLPTSTVQAIAEEIKLITELSHHHLKSSLKLQLKDSGLEDSKIDSIVKSTFKKDPVFNIHHKNEDVEQLSTHHLRSKYWHKRFPYVEPEEINLGQTAGGKKKCAHYVSIRKTLEILLRDKRLKNMVKESFNLETSSDVLKDFTDGEAYATHKCQHANGKCLQLLLFQDAFEFNAFGPSAGVYKPLGFYYTLGNISSEFRSKVDLIQLAYMILEKDTKPTETEELNEHDKLKEVLRPLIDELKDLKTNGIDVDGEKVPVCLMFMIGDSLGQHHVGSFIKSFAGEFFCRFCPISKMEFHAQPDLVKPFRTCEEYDNAVTSAKELWRKAKTNYVTNATRRRKLAQAKAHAEAVSSRCSAPSKKTVLKKNILNSAYKKLCSTNFKGVKYHPSPFNSKELNFHVCSPALAPCIGHDIFEGTVKCVLAKALKYFISDKNWFDFETLNRRIKSFKCKGADAMDPPKPLKKLEELNGNAVQNWNFLRLLPFIIGDLILDPEDKVWQICLSLKNICEFVCAPKISMEQLSELQYLVKLYLLNLKDQIEYFDGCLIPKQHFLRHYADLTAFFGPLIRLFTLRFESKHMFFKRVVRSCKSYINITYTMAKKYMCRFAYDHSTDLLPPDVLYNENDFMKFDLITDEKMAALPPNFCLDTIEKLCAIEYKGTKYERGLYIILASEGTGLTVGCIDCIFVDNYDNVSFLFIEGKAENTFNGYYEIKREASSNFVYKSAKELPDYYPLPAYTFLGTECISLKHSVCFK